MDDLEQLNRLNQELQRHKQELENLSSAVKREQDEVSRLERQKEHILDDWRP